MVTMNPSRAVNFISRLSGSSLNRVWSLLTLEERRSAGLLFCLMVMAMVLETIGVGVVIPAMGILMQRDLGQAYPSIRPVLERLGNPSQEQLVIGGMLSLVAVYFVKTSFLALLAWRQTHFSFKIQTRLSECLFAAYLRQPYTFHLQRNSAQLIRNITGEVTMFAGSGIQPIMILLTESLVLVGLFVLLLVVEPIGALIVMTVLGIAGLGFHFITRRRIAHWGKARQRHDVLLHQHLQQGLGGVKDVKLLGRETEFLRQHSLHNGMSARMALFQSTLQQLPRLWLELLAVSGLAILVISMLMQNRPLEAILPTLGLFAAAAFRLMPSVNRLLGAVQALRFGLPVIETLHKELNLPIMQPQKINSVCTFNQTLELKDVNFAYQDAVHSALREISLLIKQGESIGFIGASGSGKSTLIDIILGLLKPGTGSVLSDNVNIEHDLRGWQNQIGYVSQTIFLTDDTLRRNVAFGLSDQEIDDNAVKHAISAAQLDEFVSELPAGIETIVGERGVRLSGGQRQRIGIARALYHDPAVLVLDEATSALDAATEHEVMLAVQSLHGHKTILIVAHRLSTVEYCDRLYRLSKGSIVEVGRPSEILISKHDASDDSEIASSFSNSVTAIQPKLSDAK